MTIFTTRSSVGRFGSTIMAIRPTIVAGGLDLAAPSGSDDSSVAGRDHAQTADGKFARDHDEHDPGRHPTPADEDHHAGRHQQLIGQRVEEFAEIADLVVVAGNIAVQKIGNAGRSQRPQPAAQRSQSAPFADSSIRTM